jgi:hypothetical protein
MAANAPARAAAWIIYINRAVQRRAGIANFALTPERTAAPFRAAVRKGFTAAL